MHAIRYGLIFYNISQDIREDLNVALSDIIVTIQTDTQAIFVTKR